MDKKNKSLIFKLGSDHLLLGCNFVLDHTYAHLDTILMKVHKFQAPLYLYKTKLVMIMYTLTLAFLSCHMKKKIYILLLIYVPHPETYTCGPTNSCQAH